MTDEPTKRQLNARLAVEQSTQRLPSVVAGLVRGSELVWSHGCGRVSQASTASGSADAGIGRERGQDVHRLRAEAR